MPGIVLRSSHVKIRTSIRTTLCGRYYYYPHFTDDEIKAQGNRVTKPVRSKAKI